MPILFTYKNVSEDREVNKIGGDSLLPRDTDWPMDDGRGKMLFLASLSAEVLKLQCNIVIPEREIVSIFCPYKKGSIEPALEMAERPGSGRVISHLPGSLRQECEAPIIVGRKIDLNSVFETDEDEFSGNIDDKLGGMPNWLQDSFDYSGYEFVMQISDSSFSEVFPGHTELFNDGVFYVFYDVASNNGLINLQYS